MKVLAINGSPNTDRGNTWRIAQPFLDGAAEAGAEVEAIQVARHKIHPCTGEFACWLRTPGACMHDDDMTALRPKVAAADVLAFVTPVYVDGPTGQLKTFCDRLIPLVEPFIKIRGGHCRHPHRGEYRGGKAVLVSTCGFWEMDNFDPLVAWVEAVCRNLNAELVGSLLRPHAGMIESLEKMGHPPRKVYDAAREAGRQLVGEGTIAPAVLEAVSAKLAPRRLYTVAANHFFRKAINAARKEARQ